MVGLTHWLRYEDDLLKWMERLLVDLKKRIDTNTERLAAAEKPLFLVDDQVSAGWGWGWGWGRVGFLDHVPLRPR